jgi:hypothetical protein
MYVYVCVCKYLCMYACMCMCVVCMDGHMHASILFKPFNPLRILIKFYVEHYEKHIDMSFG